MYLGMIQPENRDLFLKLAAMVSLADVTEREKHDESEKTEPLFAQRLRGEAAKLSKFIKRKDEENAALKLFAKEMDMDLSDRDIERIDDKVLNSIYQATETSSEKLFSNAELRQSFFKDGLEALLKNDVEDSKVAHETVISLTERKVMLFETTAMAYADGECSELERAVLNKLAEQFDIDEEFIDEAGEVVESFRKVTQEGLELINE
jgi:uncharacterized tellurite resistance protein B-like protein